MIRNYLVHARLRRHYRRQRQALACDVALLVTLLPYAQAQPDEPTAPVLQSPDPYATRLSESADTCEVGHAR